jgi:hypothetical protein
MGKEIVVLAFAAVWLTAICLTSQARESNMRAVIVKQLASG